VQTAVSHLSDGYLGEPLHLKPSQHTDNHLLRPSSLGLPFQCVLSLSHRPMDSLRPDFMHCPLGVCVFLVTHRVCQHGRAHGGVGRPCGHAPGLPAGPCCRRRQRRQPHQSLQRRRRRQRQQQQEPAAGQHVHSSRRVRRRRQRGRWAGRGPARRAAAAGEADCRLRNSYNNPAHAQTTPFKPLLVVSHVSLGWYWQLTGYACLFKPKP
jgi:hypothetical protein